MKPTTNANGMKVLYIDIEAAPAQAYIWDLRTRYVPLEQVAEDGYILCFTAAWDGSDYIEFRSLWDDGYETMIKRAWELLDEADMVVHYNGNNYDIPRLSVEFLRTRLGPPMPSHHVDLYLTSKKFRVLSRSMNHMLKLLDLEEKIKHKGMQLWTDTMAGLPEAQKEMMEYNIRDIEVLEELYIQYRPWIRKHPNVGLWMLATGDPKCPTCGSENLRFKGYKHTATMSYKQYKCKDCKAPSRQRFAEKPTRKDILRSGVD